MLFVCTSRGILGVILKFRLCCSVCIVGSEACHLVSATFLPLCPRLRPLVAELQVSWVEVVALKKAEVSDIVSCLRDVWMPRNGVPVVFLSDSGPQFTAAVLRDFCTSVGVRKIYSTPYHPQGNSVAESYMRTLKKSLSALVAEDGRDWDLFLSAVALAHNSTPHVATGFSPYF